MTIDFVENKEVENNEIAKSLALPVQFSAKQCLIDIDTHSKLSYSFKNVNILYISDLHIDYHIQRLYEKTWEAITEDIDRIVEKIFEGDILKEIAQRSDYIIFILGDVADDIHLVDYFYQSLFNQFPFIRDRHIYYTLGNHETVKFDTLDECYSAYQTIADKYNIRLLNNKSTYAEYECIGWNGNEPLYKTAYLIVGGIGFSRFNEANNVTNLCYSKELMNNRKLEIELSERDYRTYMLAKTMAQAETVPLFVLSHCPVYDWCPERDIDSRCIYFYGHNHQNFIKRTENRTIIANNQIGYSAPIRMREIVLGRYYNPFTDYEDGYYKIEPKQYNQFLLSVGENAWKEPKGIKRYIDSGNKFFMIKRCGYYGFFLINDKGCKICQGGSVKTISSVSDITYFDTYFMNVVSRFVNAMKPYRTVQEQISKDIQSLGFEGCIHGCIIDIDFYNHIMLNPYDGTVSFYYSPIFGTLQKYNNLKELIVNMEGGEKILENKQKQLSELTSKNALVCQNKEELQCSIEQAVKIDIKSSIYSESRKLNQLQRLFNGKVLRVWDESIVQTLALADGRTEYLPSIKLSSYNMTQKHWKNLLKISRADITDKIIQIALKGNSKYVFPYLSCEKKYGETLFMDLASDNIIFDFISLISNSELQAKAIEMTRESILYDRAWGYFDEGRWHFAGTSTAKHSFCATIRRIKDISELAYSYNLQDRLNFNELLLQRFSPIEIIKSIEDIPIEYRSDTLHRILAGTLTQKHRPKWCPKEIWDCRDV